MQPQVNGAQKLDRILITIMMCLAGSNIGSDVIFSAKRSSNANGWMHVDAELLDIRYF